MLPIISGVRDDFRPYIVPSLIPMYYYVLVQIFPSYIFILCLYIILDHLFYGIDLVHVSNIFY